MMRGDDGTLFEKLPKKSQLLKFIYAVIPVKRSALKKAYIFFDNFELTCLCSRSYMIHNSIKTSLRSKYCDFLKRLFNSVRWRGYYKNSSIPFFSSSLATRLAHERYYDTKFVGVFKTYQLLNYEQQHFKRF